MSSAQEWAAARRQHRPDARMDGLRSALAMLALLPMVALFLPNVRGEVLSVEAFDSVLEAQTVITDWRTIYNHRRPHSSLRWRPPAAHGDDDDATWARAQR